MRTKLANREVGHAWYYNTEKYTQYIGAENFFYSGNIIYSYGMHYPIAAKIADVVLFTVDGSGIQTTSSYGPSTSKHVSITAQAIPYNTPVIYVDNPAAACKRDHIYNYDRNMTIIADILKLVAGGRNGSGIQTQRTTDIRTIVEQMNQYTKIFKLGKRQIDIEKILDPVYLEDQKKKAKALAKKKAKKEALRQEQIRKDNEETIKVWKAGAKVYMPHSIQKCYLRLSEDRQQVETSQGATLKLSRAVKLFDYVTAVLTGAMEYRRVEFGGFTLLGVNSNEIIIGCHKIEISELNRLHATLN